MLILAVHNIYLLQDTLYYFKILFQDYVHFFGSEKKF